MAQEAILEAPPGNARAGAPGCPNMIDRQHLAKYTYGDSALEAEILQLFVTQVEGLVEQLASARETEQWSFVTHTLKGSARAVGAWQIAEMAQRLEAAGPPVSSARPEMVGRLRELVAATVRAAKDLQAEN